VGWGCERFLSNTRNHPDHLLPFWGRKDSLASQVDLHHAIDDVRTIFHLQSHGSVGIEAGYRFALKAIYPVRAVLFV